MAANRFATMLHRNTNKIALILIYAVLEWILIVLLLLNSLFAYLVFKFAEIFGLQPPCPWCTRIDHVFDPAKRNKDMNTDFLCEVHSKEILKLGFCSTHQKLVHTQDMCDDCLPSRPEFEGPSRNFGLSGRTKKFGSFQSDKEKVGENGEVSLDCSCCGVSLGNNSDKYSSYVLLKTSSWDDVLECIRKENLITETGGDDDNRECVFDENVSEFTADLYDYEKVLEDKSKNRMIPESEGNLRNTEEKNGFISVIVNELQDLERGEKEILKEENSNSIAKHKSVQVCVEEDYVPLGVSSQHLEFFLDYSGHKLVPVELIDSFTEEHNIKEGAMIEKDEIDQEVGVVFEIQVEEKGEVVVENGSRIGNTFLDDDLNEEPKHEMHESMESEEDKNSLFFHAKGCHLETEGSRNFRVFPLAQQPSEEASDVQEPTGAEREKCLDVQTVSACEEVSRRSNENAADASIGTEVPDVDITDEIQIQDSDNSYESIHEEDPLTSSANLYAADGHGLIQIEEQMVETQTSPVYDRITNNEPSLQMELKEIEEDKAPDTPTSMDSLNLNKKLLLLEKRDSGTEESMDGSVTSELDGSDGVVTIERLKSALRSERKALRALYAELEEERSASAVATNQTMAMINRLQEEKAAMQMEALQYQRMMEEQSEYDQEALQLLNELMVKREKENQELERELEVYRKKLLDYEMKEQMRVLKKSKGGSIRSGCSSACCGNAEDSDGLSVDLIQEAKEEEGFYGNPDILNQNTPVDSAFNLEGSVADFEEERLSILEQLKVLEEKLLTLDSENEQHFEDVKAMYHLHENGHFNCEADVRLNKMMNVKHYRHRRIACQNGKSLLPLFDAISDENGDAMITGNGFDSNGVHGSYEWKLEMEKKQLAIEEEVGHLYERLHALEADREFFKHCISSLKKGDKGMDLLQEILQHLRDLRNVELRVRNLGDSAII